MGLETGLEGAALVGTGEIDSLIMAKHSECALKGTDSSIYHQRHSKSPENQTHMQS